MASKESPSRTEIQEAIKKQGEIVRKLKLEEQTDEVKNKVIFVLSFQPISLKKNYIALEERAYGMRDQLVYNFFARGIIKLDYFEQEAMISVIMVIHILILLKTDTLIASSLKLNKKYKCYQY